MRKSNSGEKNNLPKAIQPINDRVQPWISHKSKLYTTCFAFFCGTSAELVVSLMLKPCQIHIPRALYHSSTDHCNIVSGPLPVVLHRPFLLFYQASRDYPVLWGSNFHHNSRLQLPKTLGNESHSFRIPPRTENPSEDSKDRWKSARLTTAKSYQFLIDVPRGKAKWLWCQLRAPGSLSSTQYKDTVLL